MAPTRAPAVPAPALQQAREIAISGLPRSARIELARRTTAYRDAGHAVAAIHFGLPLSEVSIVAGADSNGHVRPRREISAAAVEISPYPIARR